MQQRVREPYRGINPSSARQLPILAALHAGSPTLFGSIIHDSEEKVNTQIANIGKKLSIVRCLWGCAERCRAVLCPAVPDSWVFHGLRGVK